MDTPEFQIGQVAAASGVPANTIRTWFTRKQLLLTETDSAAAGAGLARLLSLRSALRIAAMGALAKCGVDPAEAGKAALLWTDFAPQDDGRVPNRDPGELFRDGLTILCWYGSDNADVKHSADATNDTLFIDAFGANASRVVAVRLNDIDRQVRTALEGHYVSNRS